MKAKGKKFVSLFLIFSILALSGNLIAKERRGAELIVQKKDGKEIRGELIAVKQNSLLMLVSGADVSVDIKDIIIVTIVRKSEALAGSFLGLFLGSAIGYGVGYSLGTEGGIFFRKEETGALGLAIGGLIGTGIGAGIGAAVGTDKKIFLYIKPKYEVARVLEKLRKKARYPNYQ